MHEDVVRRRDVLQSIGIRIGNEAVGRFSDGAQCSGASQDPVVRQNVWVSECQLDRLASSNPDFRLAIGQVGPRFHRDGASSFDRLLPSVRFLVKVDGEVGQNGMCCGDSRLAGGASRMEGSVEGMNGQE